MQDKDFDQLFKDKFDEAEMMPSANLWSNIEKELTPKKKRVFPIYWAAAAAVAVIAVSAGLWSSAPEKMQLQGHADDVAVVTPTAAGTPETLGTTAGATQGSSEETPLVLAPKVKLPNLVEENNQLAVQRNEKILRHQLKAVTVNTVIKEEVEEPLPQVSSENVIANVVIPNETQGDHELTETEGSQRKGIRNVGDVINFVVDKLDKRDKKLIQFKTDDDDNSSLIAVNIGILKFNSKRNK